MYKIRQKIILITLYGERIFYLILILPCLDLNNLKMMLKNINSEITELKNDIILRTGYRSDRYQHGKRNGRKYLHGSFALHRIVLGPRKK